MHGNTRSSPESGVKTRQFSSIMSELSSALRIHKEQGSRLGGVHLELTGVSSPSKPLFFFFFFLWLVD